MHERILLSGLTETRGVPSNYQRLQKRHGVEEDAMPLNEALERLGTKYGIEWRDLFYETEPDLGTHEPVDHYRALINPAWDGLPEPDIPGDRKDAVWHIPTKQYTKVEHKSVWEPLSKAIARRGSGTNLFGTIRIRREGGEVHMDLFFADSGVSGLDTSDEITLGISTGHDYYGNVRLYVDAIAYHDTGDGVGQVMRYLVDPKRRKHTGDAGEEVINWYDQSVERLDTVSDQMYNIVANAMHYEIPLADIPCSVEGFFDHLGLPNRGASTLAEPAGDHAVKTAAGPYTAWHMYKAGMWAIEHHYESRDTSSFKKHVNTVNTLLFNPSLSEKRVLKSCEEKLKERDEDSEVFDYVDDDADVTLETIRTRAKTITEGVEDFQTIRERLQKMLTDEGVKVSEEEPELESV